jgi:hypothetical protein
VQQQPSAPEMHARALQQQIWTQLGGAQGKSMEQLVEPNSALLSNKNSLTLPTNFQTMELISPGLRLLPSFGNQLHKMVNLTCESAQNEVPATLQTSLNEPVMELEKPQDAIELCPVEQKSQHTPYKTSEGELAPQLQRDGFHVSNIRVQDMQQEMRVTPLSVPITITMVDNDNSSRANNLSHASFKAIQEEAECSASSIGSNMNRVVSEILKNRKSDPDDAMSKKRRQRLTYDQQQFLETEFRKQSDWSSKGFLSALAKRSGLSKSKIYKWNWDRKKKELPMMVS